MAGPKPSDTYNPTQSVSPTTSAPSDYSTTKMTPEEAGAGVAQATSKTAGQIGTAAQTAGQGYFAHQGILNEMAATHGEATNAENIGQIQSKYRSLEGLQAVAAYPQYVQDVRKANEDLMETMPNIAAKRSFAMLTARSTAYAIKDGGDYSATQFKAAQKNSITAGIQTYQNQLGDPAVAADPARSKDAMDHLKALVQQKVQADGNWVEGTPLDKDGNPSFGSDDNAQKAAAIYKNELDNAQGLGAVTRYRTLINDPTIPANKAWDLFQEDRKSGNINPKAQAEIMAMMFPRVQDAQSRDVATQVLGQATNDYHDHFDSPQEKSSTYTEDGISTLVTGKIPGAIITSTTRDQATNARVGGAENSYHLKGQALDFVPDPKSGMTMEQAADQIRQANPNLKVIVGGPDAKHPNEKPHVHIQWGHHDDDASPNYPKNENGGMMSEADYYRTNYPAIMENARKEAESRGLSPALADQAVARTETYLRQKIGDQGMQDKADEDLIAQALHGDFNNGQPITHEYQLEYGPQNVRDAWQHLGVRNAIAREDIIQRRIPSNAAQYQKGFGDKFYDLYQGVENGSITTTAQLLKASGMELSNSGMKVLMGKMADRGTPQGQAFASDETRFIKQLHDDATGQGLSPGLKSPTLEAKFAKQLPAVFDAINFSRANKIPTAQMFNKDDPHYVGGSMIMPKMSEVEGEQLRVDRLNFQENQATPKGPDLSKMNNDQKVDLARSMWNQGKFHDKAALAKWLEDNKVSQAAPPVPAPH